jgi:hypothetical protein
VCGLRLPGFESALCIHPALTDSFVPGEMGPPGFSPRRDGHLASLGTASRLIRIRSDALLQSLGDVLATATMGPPGFEPNEDGSARFAARTASSRIRIRALHSPGAHGLVRAGRNGTARIRTGVTGTQGPKYTRLTHGPAPNRIVGYL